jgi:tetratricopeptide (TPR) repeat protein
LEIISFYYLDANSPNHALGIVKMQSKPYFRSRTLGRIANYYFENNQYELANLMIDNALSNVYLNEYYSDQLALLSDLGYIYYHNNQKTRATEIFKEALNLSSLFDLGDEDWERIVSIKASLGDYSSALSTSRNIKDPFYETRALYNAAYSYANNGQYSQASLFLENATIAARKISDTEKKSFWIGQISEQSFVFQLIGLQLNSGLLKQTLNELSYDSENKIALVMLTAFEKLRLGKLDEAYNYLVGLSDSEKKTLFPGLIYNFLLIINYPENTDHAWITLDYDLVTKLIDQYDGINQDEKLLARGMLLIATSKIYQPDDNNYSYIINTIAGIFRDSE